MGWATGVGRIAPRLGPTCVSHRSTDAGPHARSHSTRHCPIYALAPSRAAPARHYSYFLPHRASVGQETGHASQISLGFSAVCGLVRRQNAYLLTNTKYAHKKKTATLHKATANSVSQSRAPNLWCPLVVYHQPK